MTGYDLCAHPFISRLGELDVAALLTDLNESGHSEFADDLSVGQRSNWRQPLPRCDESGGEMGGNGRLEVKLQRFTQVIKCLVKRFSLTGYVGL